MTVTKTKCKYMVVTFPVLFLSVNIFKEQIGNFCFWLRQSDRDRNPLPA